MTVDADAFNAFEAAGWERSAVGYDEFFAPITARAVDALLDAAEVGSGTRLLDLATGPAYVALRADERGADVVGVDVSESMLEIARSRVPTARFAHGDIEQLPFADSSFDAVAGNFAILHVGRPERVAAEAARVLRHGGRLGLTAWGQPDEARLFGVLLEAVAAVGAKPPEDVPVGPNFFRFSDDDEFAALLSGAGFQTVEVHTLHFTHVVPSSDSLWEGLLGGTVRTRALVLGQSPEDQRRIRDALESHVAPYRTNGELTLPVSVKVAHGERA